MDKLSEHYATLLGLGDGWLVDDVDLDLANQKVVIRLSRNPDAPVYCPDSEQKRPLKDHLPTAVVVSGFDFDIGRSLSCRPESGVVLSEKSVARQAMPILRQTLAER